MAGDGDFDGAFGELLSANVVQKRAILGIFGRFWRVFRIFGQDGLVFEVEKKIFESIDAVDFDIVDEGSLGEILNWQKDLASAKFFGGFDDINDAPDGTDFAG